MPPLKVEFGEVGGPYFDDGRPTFVVGTGPSMLGFDFERLRGLGHVLAVKQAWKDLPFADACFGLDLHWLRWANADLTVLAQRMPLYIAVPVPPWQPTHLVEGAVYLERLRTCERLSDDPGAIESGGNSGFGALNLAYLKRAKKIVLLGFDFHGEHYRPDDYEDRPAGHNSQYMPNWATNFRETLPQLRAAGVQVINASPTSLVDAYPRMSIDEALTAHIYRLGPA